VVDPLTGRVEEYPVSIAENVYHLQSEQNRRDAKEGAGWRKTPADFDVGHRHFSGLHWLYPGTFLPTQRPVTRDSVPGSRRAGPVTYDESLYQAARRTMREKEKDGGGHTSWSAAWQACLWARLREGDAAWSSLSRILKRYTVGNFLSIHPRLEKSGAEECSTCFRDPALVMEGMGMLGARGADAEAIPDRGLVTLDDSKVMYAHAGGGGRAGSLCHWGAAHEIDSHFIPEVYLHQ